MSAGTSTPAWRSNIGTDVWKVIHPDDREPTGAAWSHSLATGDTFLIEQRLRDASTGQYRWFLVRAVPVRDERGEVTLWVGTTTDIHDIKRYQQELQESEARFRNMADAAPVMIWMADVNGGLLWGNQRWSEFTGLPLEAMLGTGWAQVMHPDDLDNIHATWRGYLAQRVSFSFEFRIRRYDRAYRTMVVSGVPRFGAEGAFDGYVGTYVDITDTKRALEVVTEAKTHAESLNIRLARAMQETHHRVKNNLQTIAALVEMQTEELGEGGAVQRIKQHVRALASIHDLLTQQAKADTARRAFIITQAHQAHRKQSVSVRVSPVPLKTPCPPRPCVYG